MIAAIILATRSASPPSPDESGRKRATAMQSDLTGEITAGVKRSNSETMEIDMMKRNVWLAVAISAAALAGSNHPPMAAEQADQALIKAIGGAKVSLLQGIAQVAKGTEVPTEAKYEMDNGKLMLSVYTSAKGFDTAAEDNSFNEYGGDATAAAWTPNKEVFADLKHIARSAQYHTLLSMTKVTIPAIIENASPQGTVFSVKEKVRDGKPVFEVMTTRGDAVKTSLYNLMTGEPIAQVETPDDDDDD
jgi:hypothetical protein